MPQALLVTVRFHEGRYHGLDSQKASEWPPAPARLFQALMAGAARGATVPPSVEAALDWLEELPPPVIAAPRGIPGRAFKAFVPNNDLDAELAKRTVTRLDAAVAAIRVGKRIQPILFDARTPILYCWSFEGSEDEAQTVCTAANDIYQLGRGIDIAWAVADVVDPEDADRQVAIHGGLVYRPTGRGTSNEVPLLCPRTGLRKSLATRFAGVRSQFQAEVAARKPLHVFVQPSKPRLAMVTYGAPPHRFVFEVRSGEASAGFGRWRLSAAAALVEAVRDQAADRLRDAATADVVDRYLIGRNATDADKTQRVHVVPVPSVGHVHADMAIRRLVVYVPQSCPLAADDVAWAFSQVVWADDDGVIVEELHRVDDDRMAARFERRARRWRSVTPLVLPLAHQRRVEPRPRIEDARDASARAGEEARAIAAVRQALRHSGINVPAVDVHVQREPLDRLGARAEQFAAGTRFSKRDLWHVTMTFADPVAGPMLLGNGRYLGLGLMRPDDPMRGVLAFTISGGLVSADPAAVAHAARRAMLARVQEALPYGEKLPLYVSGHARDGRPARGGDHRHVAIAVDLSRGLILYLAPTWLQRRGLRWFDIAEDHRLIARALDGMDVLRAGAAGRLTLAPTVLDAEHDSLFAPARTWESVTDYQVTRHARRLGDEEALTADAAAELERRGWPRPDTLTVLRAHRGPRGALSGRLRITFRAAQRGPLLIGRMAHKGGGLFAAVMDMDRRSA